MKLRGVDFGPAWCSSGALGFFGDGYWYHKLLRPFGLDYRGVTFVAKTTTLEPRAGNMPLRSDGVTPRELVPACVKVRPFKGVVLNSVGLSGPGAKALFNSGRWQERTSPFLISFMSVAQSAPERLREVAAFTEMMRHYLPFFQAPVGLEINFSCPNVGVQRSDLRDEVRETLNVASRLQVPLIPNFSPDADPDTLCEVAEHPWCDAVSVANTLKWGSMSRIVDWKGIWGTDESPLAHLGGGGMSGKPLFSIVGGLMLELQLRRIRKPVVAGGGVLSRQEAYALRVAGASAVKLGTVGMLRPWRVRGIVKKIRDPRTESAAAEFRELLPTVSRD